MEIFTLDGWLLVFLNSVWAGFSVITPGLLVLRLLKKPSICQGAANWQYAANLVLAVAAVLYAISWAVILYEVNKVMSAGEDDGPGLISIYDFYEFLFIIAGILLFIPKLRRSWTMTLIAFLSLHIGTVVGFFRRMNSDDEPSPWTVTDTGDYILGIAIYFIIVVIVYYLLRRTKRLPYN